MTGMSGTLTIQMPDILTASTWRATRQALARAAARRASPWWYPPTSPRRLPLPHMVMQCKNAAAAPTVVLQGGSVVLGGFVHRCRQAPPTGAWPTTWCASRRALPQPPGAGGVTSVPTLSQWGVMLLSALSALLGWAHYSRGGGAERLTQVARRRLAYAPSTTTGTRCATAHINS